MVARPGRADRDAKAGGGIVVASASTTSPIPPTGPAARLKLWRAAVDAVYVKDQKVEDVPGTDPFVGRLRTARNADPRNPLDALAVRDLVVEIVEGNHFKHLSEAFAVGNNLRETFARDLPFQYGLGFAAWVDRKKEETVEQALRVVALDRRQSLGYRLLGMAHLTAGRPTEAYLALMAGMASCQNAAGLEGFLGLAQNLMEGRDQVEFAVDGVPYRFLLSCFNGQAMEAAVVHCSGSLTELAELRFLRDEVKTAPVILEVGTMVGNHTVFLMKNLKPEKLMAFDADIESIRHTQMNCVLNDGDDVHTEVVLTHKAIGREAGRINLIGTEVELTTLDAEMNDASVDLLKIDVDGMELALLEGARALIRRCKPRMLIEISPSNMRDFETFLGEVGYVIQRRFERDADTNCFAVPA